MTTLFAATTMTLLVVAAPTQAETVSRCHKTAMSGYLSPTRDEYSRAFTQCMEQVYPTRMK